MISRLIGLFRWGFGVPTIPKGELACVHMTLAESTATMSVSGSSCAMRASSPYSISISVTEC